MDGGFAQQEKKGNDKVTEKEEFHSSVTGELSI